MDWDPSWTDGILQTEKKSRPGVSAEEYRCAQSATTGHFFLNKRTAFYGEVGGAFPTTAFGGGAVCCCPKARQVMTSIRTTMVNSLFIGGS
jgi:hypothetical protein